MFPIFKIALVNRFNNKAGTANAILVDKEKGLFVTNAHVLNGCDTFKDTEVHVGLPHIGRFQQGELNEKWINWDADLGYVRMTGDFSSYPDVKYKSVANREECEELNVVGYRSMTDDALTETPGHVMRWSSPYGVNPQTLRVMWHAEERGAEKAGRIALYKDFVLFYANKKIGAGQSGSALLDQKNRLAGILSSSNSTMSLGIPSYEFRCGKAFYRASSFNDEHRSATSRAWAGWTSWFRRSGETAPNP